MPDVFWREVFCLLSSDRPWCSDLTLYRFPQLESCSWMFGDKRPDVECIGLVGQLVGINMKIPNIRICSQGFDRQVTHVSDDFEFSVFTCYLLAWFFAFSMLLP